MLQAGACELTLKYVPVAMHAAGRKAVGLASACFLQRSATTNAAATFVTQAGGDQKVNCIEYDYVRKECGGLRSFYTPLLNSLLINFRRKKTFFNNWEDNKAHVILLFCIHMYSLHIIDANVVRLLQ